MRDVRVLLSSKASCVRISRRPGLTVEARNGDRLLPSNDSDWIEISPEEDGTFSFDGRLVGYTEVEIKSSDAAGISLRWRVRDEWTDTVEYPGSIHLSNLEADRLRIINHVDLESYVASVVAREVWPTFKTTAFQAQAVVSRTFAIVRMDRRSLADWDIVATQKGQVYRGIRRDVTGVRAARAAAYTSGVVCTFNDGSETQLFPTYFSAACGGYSQAASIFGDQDDITPLQGGVACDYCRIAPGKSYRWGDVTLSLKEIQTRIVKRYPNAKSIGDLRKIDVSAKTDNGRVVKIELVGSTGERFTLMAENFRLAIGARELRSTDFKLTAVGDRVVFKDGRGFGHGLGLCQWGMEGQAREGKTAAEILRYYFPGSAITRAY